jgi:hypothetical protein
VVELGGDRWDGEALDVNTTNGGVVMSIPDNYSAKLETGTTNGGISTDFVVPVTIRTAGARPAEETNRHESRLRRRVGPGDHDQRRRPHQTSEHRRIKDFEFRISNCEIKANSKFAIRHSKSVKHEPQAV